MSGGSRDRGSGAVLGIDTATSFLSLALIDGEGVVRAQVAPDVGREHAMRIVPELDALFAAADVSPTAIRAIAVGVGPGSYTGLRIGIATAKGLAHGWRVPVAGSDTLAAIAAAGLEPGETGIVAIDARRGRVYFGVYRREATGTATLVPPSKGTRLDVAARHPHLRIVEGVAPSAAWHARALDPAAPARARYL